METEFFTVYIKGDSIRLEISEDILNAYGKTLEDFEAKFDSDNLGKCVVDILKAIV